MSLRSCARAALNKIHAKFDPQFLAGGPDDRSAGQTCNQPQASYEKPNKSQITEWLRKQIKSYRVRPLNQAWQISQGSTTRLHQVFFKSRCTIWFPLEVFLALDNPQVGRECCERVVSDFRRRPARYRGSGK